MNENINFCEILKGHEKETFYSPIFGNVTLTNILANYITIEDIFNEIMHLDKYGKYSSCKDAECVIFPSKDQRNWDKWLEEQKIPKTWNELVDKSKAKQYIANTYSIHNYDRLLPIEKSALALLKIYQLIEAGYGGNISNKEWDSDKVKVIIVPDKNDFKIDYRFKLRAFRHIAFHTKEQANKFLSYEENKQLLRDYYML